MNQKPSVVQIIKSVRQVLTSDTTPETAAAALSNTAVIRVEICGAVLHVTPDCSPERAAALAAALRKVL